MVVEKDSIDARLVLFITQGIPSASIDDLEQHLKGRLAAYMVPSHIFSLIQMPRSGSGKLDRNALAARIDVDMGGDLHEIDAVLESHCLVASAATVISDGKPVSLVVCRPHAGYGVEKELTEFCRIKLLSANAVPSEIIVDRPHRGIPSYFWKREMKALTGSISCGLLTNQPVNTYSFVVDGCQCAL